MAAWGADSGGSLPATVNLAWSRLWNLKPGPLVTVMELEARASGCQCGSHCQARDRPGPAARCIVTVAGASAQARPGDGQPETRSPAAERPSEPVGVPVPWHRDRLTVELCDSELNCPQQFNFITRADNPRLGPAWAPGAGLNDRPASTEFESVASKRKSEGIRIVSMCCNKLEC